MAYVKNTWVHGDKITAAKMNHLEQGVADAHSGGGGEQELYNAIYGVDTYESVREAISDFKIPICKKPGTPNVLLVYSSINTTAGTITFSATRGNLIMTATLTSEDVWSYEEVPTSGGSGVVDSVNGKTGSVVLNASDVGAATADSVDVLYKLTRGQAWDILADNTTAYKKTIPSGTHLSVLNGWGGKSIVWNQMIPIPETDISKSENGVTFTDNRDGTYTVSTTASGASAATSLHIPGTYTLSDPNMGKVLVQGCPPNGSASTFCLKTEYFQGTFTDYGSGGIYENTSQYIGGDVIIAVQQGTIITTPLTFKPQWFYLTEMFGAGNEPSTVEQFRAMFPDDYYPYNEGETMHGDVTSIVLKSAQQTTVKTVTVPASVRALTGYGQTGSAITYNSGAKTWAYTYNGTTTDITAFMTGIDNYFPGEPGGTLTFVNSNSIPVPSQIDNYRNLSEVTP